MSVASNADASAQLMPLLSKAVPVLHVLAGEKPLLLQEALARELR
jgi:hypothetical protein